MTAPSELPTILIVEDNPNLLDLLLLALPRLGPFRVFGATDGVSGLERCMELRPDCMVVDVMMPELNGYQLVRALRGDPQTATIPLIILTAMAQQKDQLIGLAAGADQYLLKPVTPQQLVAAIQQALKISEEERFRRWQALLEQAPPEAQ